MTSGVRLKVCNWLSKTSLLSAAAVRFCVHSVAGVGSVSHHCQVTVVCVCAFCYRTSYPLPSELHNITASFRTTAATHTKKT